MSSWARRAADIGSVVTSCGHPGSAATPPYRLEKVKFGVPLDEVCKNNDNIPGPLLVLILKLNKESPNRRDVFRAPGHQGAMKKLIHFLQSGRLVNVDNYSVYTIASVLKKFLRKIPNGIFGRSGEKELFEIIELGSEAEQTERLHRLLTTLPRYTQHLLVLLFGTFRVIASNAAHAGTGMTSEALGVSVAPSFFQSCVSDGKTARMEDVLKFKVATKIMKHIIDKFATHDLFGRDNYEYYARVTGRILKVQDEWICSFQYPPPPRGKLAQQKYALQHSLEAEKTWLQCQCERWGLLAQEESRSTPALLTSSSSALDNSVLSLGVTPEHSFIESCARLSVSLEGPGLFAMTSSPIPKRSAQELQRDADNDDADEEHYADDDADDDDDDEDDFAAELEMGNDDDIENNQKNYLLPSTTGSAPVGGRRQTRNAATNIVAATISGDVDAHDDDDDDDEVTVVKRRYRQNKKKILTQTRMQQHQRRLRAGSKSLDSGDRAQTTAASENGTATVGASNSKTKASTHLASKATRTCSRCNRGIRHSSSCSSASGGTAGNGSGMTMEELRAVNRYAESTKSLSYLPQVHERQTARMRTRSEWFLGPKDSVVALQLPNTCSNCCLAAAAQQQQQHYQQHSYLGGGSTRDMRSYRSDFDNDDHDDSGAYVRNYGANLGVERDCDAAATGNALYLYYKKRLQQQKQLQQQQQQRQAQPHAVQSQFEGQGQVYCLQAEHMDTDESTEYDTQIHSTAAFMAAGKQPDVLLLRPTTAAVGDKESSRHEAAAEVSASCGRRMFLDTNTVGNIRLSNSAESVQYPVAGSARRPSARRFIGVNVPRQYPLRASLRRREKQIGSNNSGGSAGSAGSGNIVTENHAAAMLPAANAPPSVRNSIAECCAHGSAHILTPTFPYNRLEGRATSLEYKQPLRAYMDADAVSDACDDGTIVGNMFMDTMEALKAVHATCGSVAAAAAAAGSGSNNNSNRLIYTTATINSGTSPILSSKNSENVAVPPPPPPLLLTQPMRQQQQQQTAKTGQADDGTGTDVVSTITFKAPRV